MSFPTLWPVQGWTRVILCLFSANGLPVVKPGYYFAPYTLLNKQKVGQQHVRHVCNDLYGWSYIAQLVVEKGDVGDILNSDKIYYLLKGTFFYNFM